MVKAGRLLKNSKNIVRFPCAAHTLQLVVGKGLVPAERLVARAKRLINFFTTPKQTERLIDIQKTMRHGQEEDLSDNDHYLRLISDVSTRWNSSYLAWIRLEKIHDYIDVMAMAMLRDDDPTMRKDGKRLREINLNEDEWNTIKQLIKILEPFASGTELLEGSNYATISFMYDAIAEITNGIIDSDEIDLEEIDFTDHTTIFDNDIAIEDSDDDEINDYQKRRKILVNIPQNCNNLIGKVRSALYTAMNYYWNVPQDEGMIATFLDPRCKSLNFASESQKTRTKTLLREIYEKEKRDLGTNHQQQNSQSPGNPLLRTIFANRYRPERHDEIEVYIKIEEIGLTTCPFKWWASQESRFPILSKLAKKYLAIPASSASSERLFSDAGNVMTVRRTNLLPSTFEHLVFCKRNWRLVGKIFPESE
jgi:hypothetical protein